MDLLEPWRNAPPARYTLESDSEEEFDPEDGSLPEGGSRTASSSRRPEPVVNLKLSSNNADITGLAVIVAIEEAGRNWAEGLNTGAMQEDGDLSVNDKKVASVSFLKEHNTAIVFFAGYLAYEGMHAVAGAITTQLKPASLTIIDAYSIATYLSQKPSTASIRYLSSSSDQSMPLDSYEPPNLVQGLTASLASQAIESGIPCQLLLFPSNLSDSTSSSLISHSARRSAAPEQIYDYGGPSPNDNSAFYSSMTTRRTLETLSKKLGWQKFGWKVPTSSTDSTGRRLRSSSLKTGFGWWKEERRLGEREIGEGGMYI